tara:strand:- start:363 stop:635 length:273 start_codon:yes stop_codon:yes gene_type:complete
MARQYCTIKDVEKEPYHNTTDILGEGVTITKPKTTPLVSVRNVAGVFIEPAEQMEKYKYTMRGIKLVDPEGNILFEITMHAAPLEDAADN